MSMIPATEQKKVAKQLLVMLIVLIPVYLFVNLFSVPMVIGGAVSSLFGCVILCFFMLFGPILIAGSFCVLAPSNRAYPLVVIGAIAFGLLLTYANIHFIISCVASV